MKSISQGTVEVAHQVGDEQDRALEHADHDQVAALVVAADLGAELGDAPLQVLGRRRGSRRSLVVSRPQCYATQLGQRDAGA